VRIRPTSGSYSSNKRSCGRHRGLRDDLQNTAKRDHALARCLDRRRDDRGPVPHRQMDTRDLSRQRHRCVSLRRSELADHIAASGSITPRRSFSSVPSSHKFMRSATAHASNRINMPSASNAKKLRSRRADVQPDTILLAVYSRTPIGLCRQA
jgi:hypothetical protein